MSRLVNKCFNPEFAWWDNTTFKVGVIAHQDLASWEHKQSHDDVEDIEDYYFNIEPIVLQRAIFERDGLTVDFHDGNHRVNTLKKLGLPIPVFIFPQVEQHLKDLGEWNRVTVITQFKGDN